MTHGPISRLPSRGEKELMQAVDGWKDPQLRADPKLVSFQGEGSGNTSKPGSTAKSFHGQGAPASWHPSPPTRRPPQLLLRPEQLSHHEPTMFIEFILN